MGGGREGWREGRRDGVVAGGREEEREGGEVVVARRMDGGRKGDGKRGR